MEAGMTCATWLTILSGAGLRARPANPEVCTKCSVDVCGSRRRTQFLPAVKEKGRVAITLLTQRQIMCDHFVGIERP